MHPKFIIQEGNFRMGRCDLHRELSNREMNTPIGGGWWHLNRDEKVLYLFDQSYDFGRVSPESITSSLKDDPIMKARFGGHSVRFSEMDRFDGIDEIIKNSKEIHKFE